MWVEAAQASSRFGQRCFSGGDSTFWVENTGKEKVLGVGTFGGMSVMCLWDS